MSKETLCWTCVNCRNGCSWARDLIPVTGWTAKATVIAEDITSYLVTKCPKYKVRYVYYAIPKICELLGITEGVYRSLSRDYVINLAKCKGHALNYTDTNRCYEIVEG